jgi:hypothetical protein
MTVNREIASGPISLVVGGRLVWGARGCEGRLGESEWLPLGPRKLEPGVDG